jgi:hypothetical protein
MAQFLEGGSPFEIFNKGGSPLSNPSSPPPVLMCAQKRHEFPNFYEHGSLHKHTLPPPTFEPYEVFQILMIKIE